MRQLQILPEDVRVAHVWPNDAFSRADGDNENGLQRSAHLGRSARKAWTRVSFLPTSSSRRAFELTSAYLSPREAVNTSEEAQVLRLRTH